ncbi:MAG: hypothetical protein M3Y51_00605 [Actinomycetota bacterium]|nr:hypothetical protein [Actinomycetota bacterium]
MDTRVVGTVMGVVRTGVGASLVVAPAWAGRIWVGDDADGPGTKVFARALGARDVALGAGILAASAGGRSEQIAHLVQLGAIADAADVAATLVAWRNLEGSRRVVMPLVALGVGLAGVAAATIARRAAAEDETTAAEDAGIVDQQGAVLELVEDDAGAAAVDVGD